jgi:hypothetical protein
MVLRSTVHQRFYERLSQIVREKEGCGLALVYIIPTLLTELLFDQQNGKCRVTDPI